MAMCVSKVMFDLPQLKKLQMGSLKCRECWPEVPPGYFRLWIKEILSP